MSGHLRGDARKRAEADEKALLATYQIPAEVDEIASELQIGRATALRFFESDWFARSLAQARAEGAQAVVDAVEAVLPIGPRPHVDLHSIGAYDLATKVRAAVQQSATHGQGEGAP